MVYVDYDANGRFEKVSEARAGALRRCRVALYWKTKDGKFLKISEMQTEHLQNINAMAAREGRPVPVEIATELLRRLAKVTEVKNNKELDKKDQWVDRREVKSETSDRVYIVSRHKVKGFWACSCMGWRRNRKCKHVDAIVAGLEKAGKAKKPFADNYKRYKGKPGSVEEWEKTFVPSSIEPEPVASRKVKL
jgi:hypothetical protein